MVDYARWHRDVTDVLGNLRAGEVVNVEVRKESDGLLATIYSGRTGGALANPFTVSDGLAEFHAAASPGGYQVRLYVGASLSPASERTLRYEPVGLLAESDGTFPGVALLTNGSAAAPALAFASDTNTGIYWPGADQIGFSTGGALRWVMDSNGFFTFGNATNLVLFRSTIIQANHGSNRVAFGAGRFTNDAFPAQYICAKSRSSTVGTNTIVQNGDAIGEFDFVAADGVQYFQAAAISAFVDGVPATNVTPGRLDFLTNSGGTTVSARFRVQSTVISVLPTTASTSTTTGALVVAGGLGVAGATFSAQHVITSSNANALAVGANGSTNPVLQVDASTASVVTGLKVTGAASGAGLALAVVSSAANDNLTINAKGSGTIGIGSVSTGKVTITPAVDGGNAIKSIHATAGLGYGTGAGGAVTQATSKSNGVTLDKVCGQITMNNAALNAGVSVSFTLTNSAIAATDVVEVNIASAASADSYHVSVTAVAAGSCRIQVRNFTAGNLSETLVLNFAVIKAVAA